MNDQELKAAIARASSAPCECLICTISKIGFGPKGTVLTKPKKPAKVKES